jgi:hypothetical protein
MNPTNVQIAMKVNTAPYWKLRNITTQQPDSPYLIRQEASGQDWSVDDTGPIMMFGMLP